MIAATFSWKERVTALAFLGRSEAERTDLLVTSDAGTHEGEDTPPSTAAAIVSVAKVALNRGSLHPVG